MKKISLIILFVCGMISVSHTSSAYYRQEVKTQDYIESYLVHLFGISGAYGYETLKDIRQKDYSVYIAITTIRNKILDYLQNGRYYSAPSLAAVIQQQADDYVEQNINNVVRTNVSNKECAASIKWLLMEQFKGVKANVEKFRGDYTPFVGNNLKDRVVRYQNDVLCQNVCMVPAPSAPAMPCCNNSSIEIIGKYDTAECISCYEDFSWHVVRVRLSCGHSLCASCARDWFYMRANHVCPTCRTVVDTMALARKIGS